MDATILNQTRRIREEELRSVNSRGNCWAVIAEWQEKAIDSNAAFGS